MDTFFCSICVRIREVPRISTCTFSSLARSLCIFFYYQILQILVHHEPSLQDFFANSTTYYNNPDCCGDVRKTLDANGLLSAFNYGSWDGYCLAHLFTFVNFDSGLLGLANIASSFQSQTGGVCSKGEVVKIWLLEG